MCYTIRSNALRCRKCHEVIEFRHFEHIRCEEQANKYQAARCIQKDWTSQDIIKDTESEFLPVSYCTTCQATIFKEKANEAAVSKLAGDLVNSIDVNDVQSSFPPITDAEIVRLTKPKAKPSIFIKRRKKKSVKPEDVLLHKTAEGRVAKSNAQAKIQIAGGNMEDMFAFLTINQGGT